MSADFARTHATVRTLAALLFAASAIASAENAPVLPPRWAPAMLGVQNLSQIDNALKRTFDASFSAYVRSDSGRRKVNIDSYLAWLTWRGKIAGTEPAFDYAELRGQGAQCDALAMVQAASPARRSALPDDLAMVADARLYPATLWIAVSDDDVARLARPGLTLASASGKQQWKGQQNGLLLESQARGVRLAWIARADFDGDGWEDGLYRWEAWVRGGTWTDTRLVILTRRSESAPLVEVAPAQQPEGGTASASPPNQNVDVFLGKLGEWSETQRTSHIINIYLIRE